MENINKRKIKISLWFLVLTVLFIVAIIFTIIHICNSSKANTDDYYSTHSQNTISNSVNKLASQNQNSKSSNNNIDLNSLDDFTIIDDTHTNSNVATSTNTDNSSNENLNSDKVFKLNNHTYKFDNTKKVMLNTGTSNQNMELQTDEYVLKMNTDTMYYESLKSKENLRDFFEKNYKIVADSNIKSGILQDLDVIVCTFTEDGKVGYFIVTKLNESEIIYFKLYNKADMSKLISDLSKPLDEISSIIKNSIE